jgi:hypothetical protein
MDLGQGRRQQKALAEAEISRLELPAPWLWIVESRLTTDSL